jgi:hypothetical protein
LKQHLKAGEGAKAFQVEQLNINGIFQNKQLSDGLVLCFPAGKTKLSVVLPISVIGEQQPLFLKNLSYVKLTLEEKKRFIRQWVIWPSGNFSLPGDTFYRQNKSFTMSTVYRFLEPHNLVLRLTYPPFDPSRALYDGKIHDVLLNGEGGCIVMEQVPLTT